MAIALAATVAGAATARPALALRRGPGARAVPGAVTTLRRQLALPGAVIAIADETAEGAIVSLHLPGPSD